MPPKYLWVIAHSYDWEEGFRTYLTEQAMLNAIREDFDISEDIPDPPQGQDPVRDPADATKFWDACTEAYNADAWKSYQAVKIDAETGMHENIW